MFLFAIFLPFLCLASQNIKALEKQLDSLRVSSNPLAAASSQSSADSRAACSDESSVSRVFNGKGRTVIVECWTPKKTQLKEIMEDMKLAVRLWPMISCLFDLEKSKSEKSSWASLPFGMGLQVKYAKFTIGTQVDNFQAINKEFAAARRKAFVNLSGEDVAFLELILDPPGLIQKGLNIFSEMQTLLRVMMQIQERRNGIKESIDAATPPVILDRLINLDNELYTGSLQTRAELAALERQAMDYFNEMIAVLSAAIPEIA